MGTRRGRPGGGRTAGPWALCRPRPAASARPDRPGPPSRPQPWHVPPSVPGGSAPSTDRRRAGAGPAGPATSPARSGQRQRRLPRAGRRRLRRALRAGARPGGVPCAGARAASVHGYRRFPGASAGGAGRPGFSTADSYRRPSPAPRASPAAGRGEGSPRLSGSRPSGARPQGFAEPPRGCRLRWGAAPHRLVAIRAALLGGRAGLCPPRSPPPRRCLLGPPAGPGRLPALRRRRGLGMGVFVRVRGQRGSELPAAPGPASRRGRAAPGGEERCGEPGPCPPPQVPPAGSPGAAGAVAGCGRVPPALYRAGKERGGEMETKFSGNARAGNASVPVCVRARTGTKPKLTLCLRQPFPALCVAEGSP